MSFWKKLMAFFAEATTPEEAVRIFADPTKSEDTRRAQIGYIESLSDKLPGGDEASKSKASAAFVGLTPACRDAQPWVRATAAAGLSELAGCYRNDIDPAAIQAALDALVPNLRDADRDVRKKTARAIASLEDVLKDEAARAALADAVAPLCQAAEPEVRSAAIFGLGCFGQAARKHFPRAEALLSDSDAAVRSSAASALWMLGEVDPSAELIEKLVRLVHSDPAPRVRADVANALGKVQGHSADVVPALARAMEDDDKDVRHMAIFAIGDHREAAEPAVPKLAKLLSNPEHQEAAMFALRAVGTEQAHAALKSAGLPLED